LTSDIPHPYTAGPFKIPRVGLVLPVRAGELGGWGPPGAIFLAGLAGRDNARAMALLCGGLFARFPRATMSRTARMECRWLPTSFGERRAARS